MVWMVEGLGLFGLVILCQLGKMIVERQLEVMVVNVEIELS